MTAKQRDPILARQSRSSGLALIVLWCLASCVADPNLQGGSEQTALLDAYRAQAEQRAAQQAQKTAHSIRNLSVGADADSSSVHLSVDLVDANIRQVLTRVLNSPLIEYASEAVIVNGTVSARFSEMPIVDGLNVLLKSSGVYAREINGVLTFQMGFRGDQAGSETAVSTTFISREVEIQNLAASDVVTLISDLFPSAEFTDVERLSASSLTETNTVYLAGPENEVAEAMTIIAQADRPVAHVIIEALVVDINTSSIESLGLSFADGASGKFNIGSLIPGQAGGNIVATFSDLASDSARVTATIDFLAGRNVAQVLARPYIATRSMQPASIAIVSDQFVRVSTADTSVVSTDAITAGISMEITPAVMADQSIRMDLSIEDSRFGATAGEILLSKERNSATTSMIVGSGQTIMIGGLNSRYRITEKAGIPWLRNVPVLNALAGEQGAVETRTELVVYVTPYIWIPGMDMPLPLQGTPDPEIPNLLSIENGGCLE